MTAAHEHSRPEPDALELFHPLVARWFRADVGPPTDVQVAAWPRIAAGENVLATAPTGSGKTLAAFLWALNGIADGTWPTGSPSVLYVSPLKALNNDIQRNLYVPLEGIARCFAAAGVAMPQIRVATRSGDTPQRERRAMLHHPPEILITTPESLNILLNSVGGQRLLRTIRTVILDEIHAVIDSKRGVHLMTAVERLTRLAGEFQRVALSATVSPIETAADFVAGCTRAEDGGYRPRPMAVVRSDRHKAYDIRVRFPEAPPGPDSDESIWPQIVADCKDVIGSHDATLLFTRTRNLCEQLTQLLNAGETVPLAYAHHGSLSREVRTEVEQRMKCGDLGAVVATNSLELGIDIGALDQVLMIQAPMSVSSAIQRAGRAGHNVGDISRATFLPTHAHDILESIVLANAIREQDIESTVPVQCPLDVLAQVIIAMTGCEEWDIDELFCEIRKSSPYRHLKRKHFDLVLEMLAGRYAGTRIRELSPRVSVDRIDNTVAGRPGALSLVNMSGGTIPDRGLFRLRHKETGAVLGELDEEFVWEASLGQNLTLGTQTWRIEKVTHNDVLALPAGKQAAGVPFWRGEVVSRDFHFSQRIGEFLETVNGRLDDPALPEWLCAEFKLTDGAAQHLSRFLVRQREATGTDLPHRHHIIVEHADTGPGGVPGSSQIIIHTTWGGEVNRPLAMALQAGWQDRFGERIEYHAADECVFLLVSRAISAADVLSLVSSATVEEQLRKTFENSGFFGARFRECAGRALLLPRGSAFERTPLWLSRLRSQELLEATKSCDDFPILLEAWRTCIQDEFDLGNLRRALQELETGTIVWTEAFSVTPSPFSRTSGWRQINLFMYREDTPVGEFRSQLRGDLIREVALTPGLRPTISPELVARFEAKRQRTAPGYPPQSLRDVLDWVKERCFIFVDEWHNLVRAMTNEWEDVPEDIEQALSDKLVRLSAPDVGTSLVVAREMAPGIEVALWDTDEENAERDELFAVLLSQWLSFYGPIDPQRVRDVLGVSAERLDTALADLADSEKLVTGQLVTGGSDRDICDAENFGTLLRIARSESAPSLEPWPAERLPWFVAHMQGVTEPGDDIEAVADALEQLAGYDTKAELWESEILPARVRSYDPSWLDTIVQQQDMLWQGAPDRRVRFCFADDLQLLADDAGGDDQADDPYPPVRDLFADVNARYPFAALREAAGLDATALSDRLWAAAWQGTVSNDTFEALRRGVMTGFNPPVEPTPVPPRLPSRHRSRTRRPALFPRLRSASAASGSWFLIPEVEVDDSAIERDERGKERVRLLLDRYGVLFRELLDSEAPALRWSRIFRSLRLLELAGEVVSGCFFEGVFGLQFASHQALNRLRRRPLGDGVWWINATDPASVCGGRSEGLRGILPKRLATTHLSFRGPDLVFISRRNGKRLTINVAPDDPDLDAILAPLRHLLNRRFQPIRGIAVETINDEDAAASLFLAPLRERFETEKDMTKLHLRRRWV